MKTALIFSMLAVSVITDDEGRYGPRFSDTTLGVDDGQYVPDDSGLYVHDDSGQYYPDGSGLYKDDGSGKYAEEKNYHRKYNGDKYGKAGRFLGPNVIRIPNKSTFKAKPESRTPPSFTPNLILVDASDFGKSDDETAQHRSTQDQKLNRLNSFGNVPSGTSHNPSQHFVRERAYPTKYPEGKYRIIKQSGDVGTDGYHWDFETENGISAEEVGALANRGSQGEVMRAKGFFKYIGPDNVVYQITYTADENGFVPKGNHLPTPPAIPASISKSLDYQKASRKL